MVAKASMGWAAAAAAAVVVAVESAAVAGMAVGPDLNTDSWNGRPFGPNTVPQAAVNLRPLRRKRAFTRHSNTLQHSVETGLGQNKLECLTTGVQCANSVLHV